MISISLIVIAALILLWLIFVQSGEATDTAHEIKTKTRPEDGMTMVYVPAGKFDLGSGFLESLVLT